MSGYVFGLVGLFDVMWLLAPQPATGSLAGDFGHSRKWRHFRRLAAKSPVSGDEFWTSGAEGGKFRGKSLVDEFSISEISERDIPETGCVFTETGSKPADGLTPRARNTVSA
jgi:hypothetical protein